MQQPSGRSAAPHCSPPHRTRAALGLGCFATPKQSRGEADGSSGLGHCSLAI
jgi:hypothetical protein